MKDAEKCIQLKPDWSKGYYRLGTVQYLIDKNEEALKTLKKRT